ncbi:MAG: metallophosphoesterase [Bacteroidaceae bacterium]|nr:metallophosphoesterase [Bacteroidaceae bacterium]
MNIFWFVLFVLLPVAAIAYLGWHLWILLPLASGWKVVVIALFTLCFLSIFLDFTSMLDRLPLPAARVLYVIGTSSLIVILYAVMLFVVLDLGRLLHVIPRSWLVANWISAAVIFVALAGLLAYGKAHYYNKVRVRATLPTEKPIGRDYKILMASDLHLGYHNPRRELARWVDMMNAESPDFILIAGDIIDISVRPLIEEDMAQEFRRLKAPVYACLGNHEYYSNKPQAMQFLADAGIRLLVDSVAYVAPSVAIIGRDDHGNHGRKRLRELIEGIEDSTYTIVLNHEPYNLDEAERCGIDFQFSGHTHRGQVWPVSWVTDRLFECSWGSYQRGSTRYYVSSGLGIWGGRFRIGTQSEYVVAELTRTP